LPHKQTPPSDTKRQGERGTLWCGYRGVGCGG